MRLRTVAGAHAGEIRDYTFQAGQAALRVGTAVRPDEPSTEPARPKVAVSIAAPARVDRKRK